MKRKIFTIILILIFVILLFIVITNRKVANQIIVSAEDIYDNIFGNEEVVDVGEIIINELQPKNATFYYSKLSDDQQKIYKSVANAVKNLDSNAKIKEYNYIDDNTTMKDAKVAIQNFFLDHPEVFYVNNDYTVSTIDLVNS